MKALFYSILLINIVFFIWEYRKGAPEIYLPTRYENSSGSARYVQKIVLLSEANELHSPQNVKEMRIQQSIASSDAGPEALLKEANIISVIHYTTLQQAESVSVTESILFEHHDQIIVESFKQNDLVAENSPPASEEWPMPGTTNSEKTSGLNFPLFACYRLKKGEHAQQKLSDQFQSQAYKLESFEQQERDANSYLVLTMAAETSQDALKNEHELKQQGIEDLWLFSEGLFKWRISLGLFSGIELAEKAKEQFSEQTNQVLEVVPSYLTKTVTIVKISTDDKQGMAAFEQKFSMIVDQKVECKQGEENAGAT